MSNTYSAILWNKNKKRYDKYLWLGIVLFLTCFFGFQLLFHPNITIETLIIRAFGTCAFILLHIILMIGPLCRLDDRFLPLLYNRRHMGVSMFLLAAIHGLFSIVQFHALGDVNPLVSVFTSNQAYASVSNFPFQVFGFFALIILFVMAATSHDFWLKNLGPRTWKALHMSVYVAYALLVAHVLTGSFQYENNPIYFVLVAIGFILISSLHLLTGWKEMKKTRASTFALEKQGFYNVGHIDEIPDDCAKTIFLKGENIAVYKYDNKVSAVHNVCKHQLGPLGEGKIIDGCITCPWHGYQYHPENGQSPPPFTEKIKTYNVQLIDNNVYVNPKPNEEGTHVEPAKIGN